MNLLSVSKHKKIISTDSFLPVKKIISTALLWVLLNSSGFDNAVSAQSSTSNNTTTSSKNISVNQNNKQFSTKYIQSDSISYHDSIVKMDLDSLDIETAKQHILIEINKERERLNLPPLNRNPQLDSVADYDVKYMYDNNNYDHTDKQWRSPKLRATSMFWYSKDYFWHIIHSWPSSIYYFMKDLNDSPAHYNIACHERGEDIGLSYYNGYRVIYVWGTRPVGL